MVTPNWLAPKQAAAILGVSRTWLWRARAGKCAGPPYYRLNRRIKYDEDEVRKFMALHRVECQQLTGGS